jgi:hypothetical protein
MRASLDATRRQLDRLREALISPSPQDLEAAIPEFACSIAAMETSAREMEAALSRGEAPPPELRAELAALCEELSVAQKLLDRGRELCAARSILVATAAGGYGASGKPAELRPGSSIRIEG